MSCKYAGTNQPRILPGRHSEECPDMGADSRSAGFVGMPAVDDTREGGPVTRCEGCQPCAEPHCGTCSRTHADVTCAECVAATRDDLHTIAQLCGSLPAEVEHRGVHGEAMMLLGPAANPEAWNHREASAFAGRVSADYLTDAHGEKHPEFVLGTWDMVWRDHLEQPTDLRGTLERYVDYLDAHMHELAAEPLVPFEDFARDLRGCRSHLQAVLHDQNQGDRASIGCFDCGGDLERRLGKAGFDDFWTCKRCRRRYTYAEYNFALRASLEAATIRESA